MPTVKRLHKNWNLLLLHKYESIVFYTYCLINFQFIKIEAKLYNLLKSVAWRVLSRAIGEGVMMRNTEELQNYIPIAAAAEELEVRKLREAAALLDYHKEFEQVQTVLYEAQRNQQDAQYKAIMQF
jgi:hypothetical protein